MDNESSTRAKFESVFGFQPSGITDLESKIVHAILQELAAPYHAYYAEKRDVDSKYSGGGLFQQIPEMIADQKNLTVLSKLASESSLVWQNAYSLATSLGINLESSCIDEYEKKKVTNVSDR
jgi:hypothetical protein